MRDLLFKNLTSADKRRKVIVSRDLVEKSGMRTKIIRHLVCLVKEAESSNMTRQPVPSLYILKDRNSKEQRQRFFCKIKGSIYTISNGRIYLITFVHSLNIKLDVLRKKPLGQEI